MENLICKLKIPVITLLISALSCSVMLSQIPHKMNLQAIVRGADDHIIKNHTIGVRITILKNVGYGKVVHTETQTTTTNAYGMMSIEIDGGQDSSTVNWSGSDYSVMIEVDPDGGTNYSIGGVSKIGVVPYVLGAHTAEKTNSTIIETDPVFSSWDKDYADLTNKPDIADSIKKSADGSDTKLVAGNNITITGKGTQRSSYWVSTTYRQHYIGEYYGGGIVFWVDHNKEHGLICSMIDLSDSAEWGMTDNYNLSDWDGLTNSEKITESVNSHNIKVPVAARLCMNYTNADYGTGIFSDWYLPSRTELICLMEHLYEIQSLLNNDYNPDTKPLFDGYYWSSSDGDIGPYKVGMHMGFAISYYSDDLNHVRAVRRF